MPLHHRLGAKNGHFDRRMIWIWSLCLNWVICDKLVRLAIFFSPLLVGNTHFNLRNWFSALKKTPSLCFFSFSLFLCMWVLILLLPWHCFWTVCEQFHQARFFMCICTVSECKMTTTEILEAGNLQLCIGLWPMMIVTTAWIIWLFFYVNSIQNFSKIKH